LCFTHKPFKVESFDLTLLFSRVFTHKPFKDQRSSDTNCCKKLIYKEQTNVYELRKKNKEQSLYSWKNKEQKNISVGYCHPQYFIYRRKQTLQKNKTLKKCTSYVLFYQRSCITS
jgi:hypothetical protein